MPYVRRSSMRRPAGARRAPARRTYRKKAPALTVKKRVPLARRSTVLANKRAIRSLSMRMYGCMQASLVHNDEALVVDDLHPLCFDLTDATQTTESPPQTGGAIYQYDGSTVPPAVQEVSHWDTPSNTNSNPFIQAWAHDRPDSGKYMLQSVSCVIGIEGRPSLSNCRIRIQVFRQKGYALPGNIPNTVVGESYRMPSALQHMNHMCDTTAAPNLLPKKYFTTVLDKWIVISSAPANVAGSGRHPTTLNKKYFRFKIRKPQLIKQKATFPNVQGPPQPDTPVPEPVGGYFGPLNRSLGSQLWCMVSSDDQNNGLHPGNVAITLSKYSEYRDPVGAY